MGGHQAAAARCPRVAFSLTLVPISGTCQRISLIEGRLREGTPESGASAVPARGFAIRSRATRTPPGRHKDRPARSSLYWRMGNAGRSASGRRPRKRGPELKPVGGNPANGKAAARRRKAGASLLRMRVRAWRGQWLACAFRRFASLNFREATAQRGCSLWFQDSGAAAPRERLRMPSTKAQGGQNPWLESGSRWRAATVIFSGFGPHARTKNAGARGIASIGRDNAGMCAIQGWGRTGNDFARASC
jgi:hypothetical protein